MTQFIGFNHPFGHTERLLPREEEEEGKEEEEDEEEEEGETLPS